MAQQDLDTAQANDLTTTAAIAAAKANVEKYQTMVGYTQITAPFDGVITYRYADPGTLIDAQGKPIVRVSDNYLLRLDFPVTVDYVKDVKLGDPVTVRVDSLNGKTFTGKISRFTHEVDDSTRTMITEIEVPNPDLELVPGMYATVVLKVEKHEQALAVPTEAVTGGKTPRFMSSTMTIRSRNARSNSVWKRRTNTRFFPACRKAIWWSSATARDFNPARKSNRNSSSFPCAMKIEVKLIRRAVRVLRRQSFFMRPEKRAPAVKADSIVLPHAMPAGKFRRRREFFKPMNTILNSRAIGNPAAAGRLHAGQRH